MVCKPWLPPSNGFLRVVTCDQWRALDAAMRIGETWLAEEFSFAR
jgi:hypothetical protein